jgi:hypothetical protein
MIAAASKSHIVRSASAMASTVAMCVASDFLEPVVYRCAKGRLYGLPLSVHVSARPVHTAAHSPHPGQAPTPSSNEYKHPQKQATSVIIDPFLEGNLGCHQRSPDNV